MQSAQTSVFQLAAGYTLRYSKSNDDRKELRISINEKIIQYCTQWKHHLTTSQIITLSKKIGTTKRDNENQDTQKWGQQNWNAGTGIINAYP